MFEIVKTASGYANTSTVLVNFDGTNGMHPFAGLIADASGNLFGATRQGGIWNFGTVFEVTGSGFVPNPPPDTTPPTMTQLAINPNPASVGTPVTLTATVNDSSTGGSTITSAEYRLNDGPWIAMSASDGSFDSTSEAVTATFTVERIGNNQVCIRGTDAAGNTSSGVTCISFQVIYVFTDFYAPIDMPGSGGTPVVNVAKPGQAIPVKWWLTTGIGSPISDPASFKTLLIRTINCQSLVGDPTAPVEEYVSAGASGLQYQGNGYWQYNWKTAKTDTGCRTLAVEFNSGQTSPVAYIQFK